MSTSIISVEKHYYYAASAIMGAGTIAFVVLAILSHPDLIAALSYGAGAILCGALTATFVYKITRAIKEDDQNVTMIQSSKLVKHLTNQNFDSEVSKGLVLVMFNMDNETWQKAWGKPSLPFIIAKYLDLEKLAEEMKDRLLIAKVVVSKRGKIIEENLVNKKKIVTFPTMILFNDGKEIDRICSFSKLDSLRQMVNFHITKLTDKNWAIVDQNLTAGRSSSSKLIKEFTDQNFDAEIAHGLVLVDFYSENCPPCRSLAPVLETLAKEKQGSLTIGKVAETEENLNKKYEIDAYPTLVLFKNGKELIRKVGMQRLDALRELLS